MATAFLALAVAAMSCALPHTARCHIGTTLAAVSANDLLNKALGQALRQARLRTEGPRGRALSQHTVSVALNVHGGTITAYEGGKGGTPPDAVILGYAALAGTTYGAIMDDAAEIIRAMTEPNADPPSD